MYRRLGQLANNWSSFSWMKLMRASEHMHCCCHIENELQVAWSSWYLLSNCSFWLLLLPRFLQWIQQCWCAQIWVLFFFNGWAARSTKLWSYRTYARSPGWHPRQKNLKFNFFDKLFMAIFLSNLWRQNYEVSSHVSFRDGGWTCSWRLLGVWLGERKELWLCLYVHQLQWEKNVFVLCH